MFEPFGQHQIGGFLVMLSSIFLSMNIVAEPTEPTYYQPFSHAPLKKDLYVYGTLQGSCKKQSLIDTREDAWQCQAFGKVYDPCFKHPFNKKNELICPKAPWSKEAIKIVTKGTLDGSLHKELDMSQTYPWAIELTDGTHCIASPSEKNTDHNYQCQHDQSLSGKLYRCKTTWKMNRFANNQTDTADIKRAWF